MTAVSYTHLITEKDVTEVVINSDVKYIYGFGLDYVFDTAYSVKEKVIEKLSEKYGGKFDKTVFDGLKAVSYTHLLTRMKTKKLKS